MSIKLQAVWYQPSLFEWRPIWHPSRLGRLRDNRSALQLIESVIAYLEWRAATCCTRLTLDQRFSPERRDYLDAAALVRTQMYATPARPELVTSHQSNSPKTSPLEKSLLVESRTWLVNEAMRLNPKLTLRRSLSRLKKEKLAAIVAPLLKAERQERRRSA